MHRLNKSQLTCLYFMLNSHFWSKLEHPTTSPRASNNTSPPPSPIIHCHQNENMHEWEIFIYNNHFRHSSLIEIELSKLSQSISILYFPES